MTILEQLLSEVLAVSLWSFSIGLVVGGVIGLVIGVIKRRIKLALLPAIFGSFWGTLTIAFIPLFSIPGLVNGGAYAGIYVLAMLIVLVPIGSVAGGLLGGIAGPQLPEPLQKRILWYAVPFSYLLLITGILIRILVFRAA